MNPHTVTLTIDSLAPLGDGVAHLEGRPIFVPGNFPGDVIEARVTRRAGALRGEVVRWLEQSPQRAPVDCPHFLKCGGCPWMALSLAAQQAAKETFFRRIFPDAAPLVASPSSLGYRRRATMKLVRGRLGFVERAGHGVTPIERCALLVPELNERLARPAPKLPKGTAELSLLASEEGAVGDSSAPKAMRLGAFQGVTLYGRADLFAQANRGANLALQALVARFATNSGRGFERTLELYAGAGNFTFALPGAVTAVELTQPSLELARRSAAEAGRTNVRFVAGDALKVADSLAREGQRFELLMLDPPRAGAKGIGRLARALEAQRVIYVSCDLATLARDAAELGANGFEVLHAQPVDQFPQTPHLESVVVFERAPGRA